VAERRAGRVGVLLWIAKQAAEDICNLHGRLMVGAGRTKMHGLQPRAERNASTARDKDRGIYVSVTYYVAG
jgi:hypothetical protein